MDTRPIIFQPESVRAILDGRKSQTRRVLKDGWYQKHGLSTLQLPAENCPYGKPGDRLYVRESFYKHKHIGMKYLDEYEKLPQNDKPLYKKKPSIHMPKRLSRITLEITNIRVERVRKITPEDGIAEGVEHWSIFPSLWDKINGKKYPWSSNPWVWVITFKVT